MLFLCGYSASANVLVYVSERILKKRFLPERERLKTIQMSDGLARFGGNRVTFGVVGWYSFESPEFEAFRCF